MKKRLILMILALFCTGISLFLTQKYVEDNLQEKDVIVYCQEIKPFTRITSEMVKVKRVGSNGLHPAAATNLNQVIGRFSSASTVAGELVLTNKLCRESEIPQGYLYELKPDERVIAVSTDLTRSVGGTVKAGDTVDLIVVLGEKYGSVPQAKTFLQQAKVIDVRDPAARSLADLKESQKDRQGQIISSSGEKLVPGAVVLAVKPFQAEQIALYQKMGEITITVNPKFSKIYPSGGARLSQMQQTVGYIQN